MEVVAILIFVIVAAAYIWLPVLRGTRRETDAVTIRLEEVGARKEAALGALVDIENERLIGKLSARDFEVLRDEYEAEALAALKELDALEQRDTEDDDLEAEIAAIRAQMECPECGGLRVPGEACSKCGHGS